MKKTVLSIRVAMLIYLVIIFPFFYLNMPIHFLFIDSFLGYIPIEIYFALRNVKKKQWFYALGFLYLLFLPNNAYLLTDLIHLSRITFYTNSSAIMTENSLSWLMFSLVITGILGMALTCFQTEISIVTRLRYYYKWSTITYTFFLVCLFIVVSCGVFLGRFLRLNSIQLFTDSTHIAEDSIRLLTGKGIVFILLFTLIQILFLCIWKANKRLFSDY